MPEIIDPIAFLRILSAVMNFEAENIMFRANNFLLSLPPSLTAESPCKVESLLFMVTTDEKAFAASEADR